MKQSLGVVAAFVAVLLALASPCAAQDTPYVEASAGYNFLRFQELSASSTSGTNLKKGVYGDVAINLTHVVGLVGQLSSNLEGTDNVSLQTVMGGLRLNGRGFGRGGGRAVAFFQLMGGLLRVKFPSGSNADRAMELGGGANIMVSNQAGIRIEADYLRTFALADPKVGDNYIRVAVGMMYGFGSR